MNIPKRALAMTFALTTALVLAACGQGGTSGSSSAATTGDQAAGSVQAAASEEAAAAGQFQGFEAKQPADLYGMADAAIIDVKELKELEGDEEQKSKANKLFGEGNTEYRSLKFDQASKKYREAIEYDSINYGANVNLTLSLLQEGKKEEALIQALRCVALFPEDPGCLLNVQVAATANQYEADDIDSVLDHVVSECANTSVSSVLLPSLSGKNANNMIWNDAYMYNIAWGKIETNLYTGERSDKKAQKPDLATAYTELVASVNNLAEGNPDDEDCAALLAYLEGVGNQVLSRENAK